MILCNLSDNSIFARCNLRTFRTKPFNCKKGICGIFRSVISLILNFALCLVIVESDSQFLTFISFDWRLVYSASRGLRSRHNNQSITLRSILIVR